MKSREKNWAGNYRYHHKRLHYPRSIEEVQELVRNGRTLKALGTRHAFNGIADSRGDLISLEKVEPRMEIDRIANTVTVSGSVTYNQLCPFLHTSGFALRNLASLPHISVAGACATATHGSGSSNGNLATAVSGLKIVTADGELVEFERRDTSFPGAAVSLGALGIVTELTLDIIPSFDMSQTVYQNLPFSRLQTHFNAVMAAGYSVSLFTDWRRARANQVWVKRLVNGNLDNETPLHGAMPAPRDLHPLQEMPATNCTIQRGVPGPWHERLPHFRMAFTPSKGDELQSEYFVPREHAFPALQVVAALHERVSPQLFVSEIRTVAADDFWLSPCYKTSCVAIHFTWRPDWTAVRQLLPLIEAALEPFEARPHWGKLFTTPPEQLHALYPKLPAFQAFGSKLDPQGKFRNDFLDKNIFGDNSSFITPTNL